MGKKRDILIAALILLVAWAAAALLLDSMALPRPWAVFKDLAVKFGYGSLLDDMAVSGFRALAGIGLAVVYDVKMVVF